MSKEKADNDLSMWFSTYGLITAERILEKYKIRLQQTELLAAMKNPDSFYHRIIRVPLKNVLNGIILQQAHDYQVYAQKLFVDYLISGESSKDADSPGGGTRELLEEERQGLIKLNEGFHALEFEQEKLIAECQQNLIQQTAEWLKLSSKINKAIKIALQAQGLDKNEELISEATNSLLAHYSLKQGEAIKLSGENWTRIEQLFKERLSNEARQIFADQLINLAEFNTEIDSLVHELIIKISNMTDELKNYHKKFYELILRINELIKLLPDYRYNKEQTDENKVSLFFDTDIGKM